MQQPGEPAVRLHFEHFLVSWAQHLSAPLTSPHLAQRLTVPLLKSIPLQQAGEPLAKLQEEHFSASAAQHFASPFIWPQWEHKVTSVLVNQEMGGGTYNKEFNANKLANGIYIIRLEAYSSVANKKFVKSVKALLIK